MTQAVDVKDRVFKIQGLSRIGTTYLSTVTDTNWQIVGTGNFNADGKVDILWRNYASGQDAVWYMDGVTRTASEYLSTVVDASWHIENH